MKTKITDAGCKAAGFGFEKNDCTVRALANATGMPYQEAHGIMRSAGRRDRHGYHTNLGLDVAQNRGAIIQYSQQNCNMSIAQVAEKYRTGRWILTTRNHAIALVDGFLLETSFYGARHRVRYIYGIQVPGNPVSPAPEAPEPMLRPRTTAHPLPYVEPCVPVKSWKGPKVAVKDIVVRPEFQY